MMRTCFYIVFLFALAVIPAGKLYAQTYAQLIANMADGVDISDRLPPLSELQSQAVENSPYFKMLDAEVRRGEWMVKEEKREWMHWMGVEGGVKYGLFDNLIMTEDLGIEDFSTHTTEQTRYNFGAYVRIPISSIFDKSNVKTAKEEKERLSFQRENKIKEFRQLVIVRYFNVIKEYRGDSDKIECC